MKSARVISIAIAILSLQKFLENSVKLYDICEIM